MVASTSQKPKAAMAARELVSSASSVKILRTQPGTPPSDTRGHNVQRRAAPRRERESERAREA
eukprot:3392227-Rhodomonas_salina.1